MLNDKNFSELIAWLRSFRHSWDGQVYLAEDEAVTLAHRLAPLMTDGSWEERDALHFQHHLEYCSKMVKSWPEWKQRVLGPLPTQPQ